MMTLYLCGAGNSEGVRLALAINQRESRWDRVVLLDDDPQKHGRVILGVEIIGSFDVLERTLPHVSEVANLVARSAAKRWTVRRRLEAYELPFAPLVHPGVEILGVTLGRDVIVYQHANIGPEVSIGEGSVVFMGATVGHESTLHNGCIVAPHAVLNARVELGEGVYVGSNAAILPEVKVGPWATIGAGSVAMRRVPPGATLMGVPGKIVYKVARPPVETNAFQLAAGSGRTSGKSLNAGDGKDPKDMFVRRGWDVSIPARPREGRAKLDCTGGKNAAP